MTWTKLVRSAAAAAVAAGLAVSASALPAGAAAPKAKAPKTAPAFAKFTSAGLVTGVGAESLTVTLDVKGGNQKLKGQSLTVNVPSSAKVTRNGVAATLADLLPGDHVAIQGTKVGTTYTAAMVHVDAPVVVEPEPVEPTV